MPHIGPSLVRCAYSAVSFQRRHGRNLAGQPSTPLKPYSRAFGVTGLGSRVEGLTLKPLNPYTLKPLNPETPKPLNP